MYLRHELLCNLWWWPLNLLRSWLVCKLVWNPSWFHGLLGYTGLSLLNRLLGGWFSYLISYNWSVLLHRSSNELSWKDTVARWSSVVWSAWLLCGIPCESIVVPGASTNRSTDRMLRDHPYINYLRGCCVIILTLIIVRCWVIIQMLGVFPTLELIVVELYESLSSLGTGSC
jgi:hypothetical protein